MERDEDPGEREPGGGAYRIDTEATSSKGNVKDQVRRDGFGMGIAFNAATTETLGQTPAQQQGVVSAAPQLAQTLATAVISGLGGALIAHEGSDPSSFLTIFLITGTLGVSGLAVARRITAAS